jgi:NAD(P)H-hydrate epimerase
MAGAAKFTSASDVRSLYVPPKNSHKGQNGKLLIVAGSNAYHGSAILAAKSATRFVDLLYFCSSDNNNELVKKLRLATACVIVVGRNDMQKYLSSSNCVLVGPGMGRGADTKRIVHAILRMKIRCVLDADALRVITPADLHSNCIITPHVIEFEDLFGMQMTTENVLACAKKCKCTIIAKGVMGQDARRTGAAVPRSKAAYRIGGGSGRRMDVIASFDGKIAYHAGGNAGMTKGGTGDTLAGLCTALYCKNDAFISACAATYLNGLAGEMLYKKFKTAYNAEDVAEMLAFAYAKSL